MNTLLWNKTGKIFLSLMLFVLSTGSFAQTLAVKSNVPYLATGSINVGMELGLAQKLSLEMNYSINPFAFADNKKLMHWIVQPEMRYWFCERFYGHFLGLHIGAGEYNISKMKLPTVDNSQNYRYEGWGALAGVSYGYSWIIDGRWNIEATFGVGVIHTDYKKFDCPECGEFQEQKNDTFLSPTKAAVSIIYIIK